MTLAGQKKKYFKNSRRHGMCAFFQIFYEMNILQMIVLLCSYCGHFANTISDFIAVFFLHTSWARISYFRMKFLLHKFILKPIFLFLLFYIFDHELSNLFEFVVIRISIISLTGKRSIMTIYYTISSCNHVNSC